MGMQNRRVTICAIFHRLGPKADNRMLTKIMGSEQRLTRTNLPASVAGSRGMNAKVVVSVRIVMRRMRHVMDTVSEPFIIVEQLLDGIELLAGEL